jgi:hypothetical protein
MKDRRKEIRRRIEKKKAEVEGADGRILNVTTNLALCISPSQAQK